MHEKGNSRPGASPAAGGRRQRGVTMIEVLVSMLIMSISLFGILSLFLNSFKLTASSNYRNIAAQQAYSIAESVRASLPIILSFAASTPAVTAGCLNTTGCAASSGTYVEISNTEIQMWNDRLSALLPAGAGTVCFDDTPNDGTTGAWACSGTQQLVIKICWAETQLNVGNDRTSTAVSAGTACVRHTI